MKTMEGGFRLEARESWRKSHRMFKITKLEGKNSCLYLELTLNHSYPDSNFMIIKIQNMFKAYLSVIVTLF